MNIKAYKSNQKYNRPTYWQHNTPKSHSIIAQQILDEKQTKHDGLVQQNGFGLAFL
jgi:hypothetical protein